MRPSQGALYVVWATHLALIAGLCAWCGWKTGVLLSLPLLAPLPGLLRAKPYTAAWCSLLVLFYVAGLLAEAHAQVARQGIAGGLTLIAAVEFAALLVFVRWRARERAAVTPV